MADQTPPAPSPAPTPTPEPAPAPAATPPTPPAKEPDPIPYGRFKEVNDQLKEKADKLAKYEAEEAKRKQDEQIKAGEHQKVIDDLKPKAERATELENALKSVIDAEIASIPKERQSLVPDLPPEKKLAWITANRKILMGDRKTDVNHPTNPADGSPQGGDNQIFTKAQIEDPVFYEKNRDAIIKALNEGRIRD